MFSRHSYRCLQSASHRAQPSCRNPTLLPRHSLSRTFHSSRPSYLVAEALQLSHSAFQEVHTLSGLPWCWSIPLTAALFRLSWLPLQVLAHPSRKRRANVNYLLQSWRNAYQRTARIKFPGGKEGDARKAEQWVSARLRARLQAIQKHQPYTLGTWRDWLLQFAFLPVWICNADVIRRMTGDERTLTSLLFRNNSQMDPTVVPAEPALVTESLWWIPDLISPDQFWILPISFGALMFMNARITVGKDIMESQRKVTEMAPGYARTRAAFFVNLSQFMLAAPFLFSWILIRNEVATAVLLYLIGSASMQLVQRALWTSLFGGKTITPLESRLPRPKARQSQHNP